jgi:hypothetical protein
MTFLFIALSPLGCGRRRGVITPAVVAGRGGVKRLGAGAGEAPHDAGQVRTLSDAAGERLPSVGRLDPYQALVLR